MDAECHSCQAAAAAGLERPPPSGDRVATPEEPNRLLPGTRWGCRDGDRLEAYPTVVVGRYLDCKIGELPEDLSLAMDVIP